MTPGTRIAAGLVVAVLVMVGAARSGRGRSAKQPIAFKHNVHVEENGMECTDCHAYAVTGVRATIPNIEVCTSCHEEALTESAEEARVVAHIHDGVPIPWQRVFWIPEHVYFSHRMHAGVAEIECVSCHGDVGAQTRPLTKPLVNLDMAACINCHAKRGVTEDCVACHR